MRCTTDWRLDSLLTSDESNTIDSVLNRHKPHSVEVKECLAHFRSVICREQRIVVAHGHGHDMIEYYEHGRSGDEIKNIDLHRVMWGLFGGLIDERGGIIPRIVEAAWTLDLVVALVAVNRSKDLFINDRGAELSLTLMPKAKDLSDVFDMLGTREARAWVAPYESIIASALMLK